MPNYIWLQATLTDAESARLNLEIRKSHELLKAKVADLETLERGSQSRASGFASLVGLTGSEIRAAGRFA